MMTSYRLKRDAMASAQELADGQNVAVFVYRDGRKYVVTYHAPMDGVGDIAPSSLRSMIDDCVSFQNQHVHDLCRGAHPLAPDYARAGHDFWLTRNRYGAGFWDGDWNEPAATILTDSSHAYGESDLYVGDDGRIYVA
jgi:hypothetical protein